MASAGPSPSLGPGELAERVVDLVARRAGAGSQRVAVETEVVVTESRNALTRFANSSIHQNVADENRHVSLKVIVDGRQASATTNRTDTGSLELLVDHALANVRLRPVDPGWPGLAPAAPAPASEHYDVDTHFAPPAARAGLVKAFVDAGTSQSRAAGYCDTVGYVTAFANSAGQRLVGRASRATLEAIHRQPIAKPADGSDRSGAAWGSGRGWQTSAHLSDLDGAFVGNMAAAKAQASVVPVDIEPGSYEVVLEPACVADMAEFLVGYGANAKAHLEGQSWLRLGEAQLDPIIDIWDDATDPRAVGLMFDAEGTPKVRLDLVRGGVSMGLAHDRRTALAAAAASDAYGEGVASTGHAVEGGEQWGAFCTNVFVGSGDRRVEELVSSVERGLLITELWYTRVLDPKTQVVTGLTRNGTFLIESGEVVRSVGDLRFTQSYVEALGPGSVLGVGNDARLAGTGAHVPSLRLASWNITGRAGR